MKQTFRIRPNKSAGIGQMIGGIIFSIIGLTVVLPMMINSGGPVWFGVLWTGGAILIAVTGAINAFSDKGIASEVITAETDETPRSRSTEDRLCELDSLRQKGLITQTEYTESRSRILAEH